MKKPRILIIEDDPDIVGLVRYNLERNGFEVAAEGDGERGLREAGIGKVDLVILDLMLPGIDGIEVCRRLRSDRSTALVPVVMLTAKGEESDIVVGLGVGADDYMAKPFSPRELVARVRACLRRGEATIEGRDRVISLPDLVIDPVRYRVTVQGRPVAVTLTEFRLLHFLAANPGRVFTRSELLPKVIGEGAFVVDRNIDVHVRNLRKKLGPKAACVETVRGVGYRFEG